MENNNLVIIVGILGSIASIIGFIVWLKTSFMTALQNIVKKEVEPITSQNRQLVEENKRLYSDINTRLQLPAFSLDAIKLTELATERKIEEITRQRDEAIASKDKESESTLQAHLDEINSLRQSIDVSTKARIALENKLQDVIVKPQPASSYNGIMLPTGLILLVRHKGRYGALQAVDQTAEKRGEFIKYAWWYQPDNSVDLLTGNSQSGFGEAFFGQAIARHPSSSPMLKIGSINIFWTTGGEGAGWVYFGPNIQPSPDYELLLTNEIDITKINITKLANQFIIAGFSYSVRFGNVDAE